MGGGSVPFCASQWHTQNCRKAKTFPAAEQDSYGTLSSLSPFRPPLSARRQPLVILGDTEHRAPRLRVRQLFGDGARFFGRRCQCWALSRTESDTIRQFGAVGPERYGA